MLVDSALNAMVVAKTFNLLLPERSTSDHVGQLEAAEESIETGKDGATLAEDPDDDDLPAFLHEGVEVSIQEMEVTNDIDPNDHSELEVAGMNEDLYEAIQMYDKLMEGELSEEEVCSDGRLEKVHKRLQEKMESMKQRTARLWIQYMEMINILRRFIRAERTGNWKLNLNTLQKMLLYFAAAGHSLYAKSVMIYVQQMLNLSKQHPSIF